MSKKKVIKKTTLSTAAKKKRASRNVVKGIAHIHSSYSNTLVTITDMDGKVLAWSSSGAIGYKGSKKSTPYAAQLAAENAAKAGQEYGLKAVDVQIKGLAPGRESAVRALQSAGLEILSIVDKTPVPHNGCRPPKKPRG